METLRILRSKDLQKIPEVIDRTNFLQKTFAKCNNKNNDYIHQYVERINNAGISEKELKTVVRGGLLTYLLHCEARVASFLGCGYYTIGPCGEELIGSTSLHLKNFDLTALHYRHVSNSVIRQMVHENKSEMEIALDRARGFTCSTLDPVTGGRHCSIGGNFSTEFLVTSTLSSQTTPAVGRALSISLSNKLLKTSDQRLQPCHQSNFHSKAVSYVSIGEGSANNSHFLSAVNLAQYSQHKGIKCPAVFVISDNNKCISLKGGSSYVNKMVKQFSNSVYVEIADGSCMASIYTKSRDVINYSRNNQRPSLLLVSNVPRRFGHAATDRQFAYMTDAEIQNEIERDPLSDLCAAALELKVYKNDDEFINLFSNMQNNVEKAFNIAEAEPGITDRKMAMISNNMPKDQYYRRKFELRQVLLNSNSQPLQISKEQENRNRETIIVRHNNFDESSSSQTTTSAVITATNGATGREPMRKLMTKVFDELLSENSDTMYIGEDVEHGGYYLVTEGLSKTYKGRVIDFPPDETAIIGTGIGMAQSGLVPIVEIPYAKYLDCASDILHEAIIANWLSNSKQPNGMIIRLQGFDKGIFGGNFHTHNSLPYIQPGLDMVCYSNGEDYVKGMRFLYRQAKAGRIVISVDSTDLLNRRHLIDSQQDGKLLYRFPNLSNNSCEDELTFHQVIVYENLSRTHHTSNTSDDSNTNADIDIRKEAHVIIVSYGNGIPTSLLCQQNILSGEISIPEYSIKVTVIDCPYLSGTPMQLKNYFTNKLKNSQNDKDTTIVVFADVTKAQPSMPLGAIALDLHNNGMLHGMKWATIGATATYNPLGSSITFIHQNDISDAIKKLLIS